MVEGRVAELVTMLLAVERFDERDVFNAYVPQDVGEGRELRLQLWEARETLRRAHGIDFAPLRGHPGVFARASSEQIAQRGRLQRARSRRAGERAAERFDLAASKATDEKSRERLEAEGDRQRLRLALMRRRGGGKT